MWTWCWIGTADVFLLYYECSLQVATSHLIEWLIFLMFIHAYAVSKNEIIFKGLTILQQHFLSPVITNRSVWVTVCAVTKFSSILSPLRLNVWALFLTRAPPGVIPVVETKKNLSLLNLVEEKLNRKKFETIFCIK